MTDPAPGTTHLAPPEAIGELLRSPPEPDTSELVIRATHVEAPPIEGDGVQGVDGGGDRVGPEPESEPEHESQPETELPPAAAAADDRDALIESLRDRLDAQERELADLREQREQERTQRDVQIHVWEEEQPSPEPAPSQPESYLLCVPTPAGYVLLDREGVLPKVGEPVAVPEQDGNFTVTKVVRLPRNGRPCAYLQRA